MGTLADLQALVITQLQTPTLAFLLGGIALAALGSRLEVPQPVFRVVVLLLLLKVGLGAGMAIDDAGLIALAVPAVGAAVVGVVIVLLGWITLAKRRGVTEVDGTATAGVFGAVSASTLAAAMASLDAADIAYEGFVGALYPFMDIAAILAAILLAKLRLERVNQPVKPSSTHPTHIPAANHPRRTSAVATDILRDALRSPALSALLLGLALGLFAAPEAVYADFYQPLFSGLLSLLMLVMGMEAWERFADLRKVAHVYVLYGLGAPFIHGLIGLGVGMVTHTITGLSAGGVALLAIMAASSSDISAPPTLRAVLPEANPSAYVGSSTGLGTPVAILSIPLWIGLADTLIGRT